MKQQTVRNQSTFTVALIAARPELAIQLRSQLENTSPTSLASFTVFLLDSENFNGIAACDSALLAGSTSWLEGVLLDETLAASSLPIVAIVSDDGELSERARARLNDELRLEDCSTALLQRALLLVAKQSSRARAENYQGLQEVMAAADELLKFDNFTALLRRAVELGVERLKLEQCELFLIQGAWIRGTFSATPGEQTASQTILYSNQAESWMRDATPRGSERWIVHEVDFDAEDSDADADELDDELRHPLQNDLALRVGGSQVKKAKGWRASTLIRASDGIVGIWQNDTRGSGRALDRAQQELVAVYCSLLGNIIERKRADDALRESERRFRLLTEHATDLIVRITPKGRVLYVSPSCRRTLGFEPEEMVGHSVREWVHPEDIDEAFLFQRHPETPPDIYRREMRVRRRDGSYGWFEAVSRPILDRLGRAREYQTTARDVSERRSAEDALRQSEERFRAFMDNTPAMTFIKDADGRYLYFNRTTEALHGVSLEELRGNTNFDRMPVEVARQLRDNDRKVLESGQTQEFLEVLPGKNGREQFWLTFKFPVCGANGETNIGGVAVDITERREFEAALGRSEQRLSHVIDSASMVLWAIDREGIFTLSQGQGLELLGLAPGQVVGQSSFEIYRDYPAVCDQLRSVLNGDPSSSDAVIGQTAFQVRCNPLRDENGEVVGALGVAFDITERRRAEETTALYAARLENVLEIDRAIRMAHSSSTIAEVALKQLCRYLPCHNACVAVFDPDESMARVLAVRGEDLPCRVGYVYPFSEFPPFNSAAENPQDKDMQRTLPLFVQNERVGALHLELKSEDQIANEETNLLGGAMPLSERWIMANEVAGQLAIAIQQARLLEQVRAGKTQLQTLSHRLIQAQETERRNLAHELHDEIGQVLTAVKLNLQNISRQLEARRDGEKRGVVAVEPIDQQLQHSVEIVEGALQAVRDMSLNLRPSLLDDLGLAAAMRWYVDRMTASLPVKAHLKVELPEERPSAEIETACFRIAQEALTNAIRHANAREIRIQVRQHTLPVTCPHPAGMRDEKCAEIQQIELIVSDDGSGFDVHNVRAHTSGSSLGLPGMEERAALAAGRLFIESGPGQGTRVRAYFPL